MVKALLLRETLYILAYVGSLHALITEVIGRIGFFLGLKEITFNVLISLGECLRELSDLGSSILEILLGRHQGKVGLLHHFGKLGPFFDILLLETADFYRQIVHISRFAM